MWVISRKAYRFNHPTIKLLDSLAEEHSKGKLSPDKRAYCEVKPGTAPGAFGEPHSLPDWAAQDGMFKAAVQNKNLVVLPDPKVEPEEVRAPQDDATIAATLAAAARQNVTLGGESTDASEVPAELPEESSRSRRKK